MSTYVKHFEVLGVHGRFDIQQEFREGVNILYGKNGTGKTTVLHILANVLNGAYHRFVFLTFHSIAVKLSNGQTIKVKQQRKSNNTVVTIQIGNKKAISISRQEVIDNERKRRRLREEGPLREVEKYEQTFSEFKALLPAAYFPAFRTMMEAWAAQHVRRHLPAVRGYRVSGVRNILMTDFARDLFGRFVPDLNYASTIEIEIDLTNNLEQALLNMGRKDRELLSQAFLGILPALSPEPKKVEANGINPHDMLERIRSLLETLEESPFEMEPSSTTGIYPRLRDLVQSLQLEKEAENVAVRVLNLYKTLLESRIDEQQRAFEKIQNYLDSVNEFLEGKKLAIIRPDPRFRGPLVGVIFEDGANDRLKVLSSGERQLVTLIYAATQMSKQEVVLIDEPEISLHVDWQRSLLKRMSGQLAKRQIIACTHSPVIATDYEDFMQELTLTPTHHLEQQKMLFDEED